MNPEILKELIQTILFTLITVPLAAFCIALRKKCDKDIHDGVYWMLMDAYAYSPYEFFDFRTYRFDGMGFYAYSNHNFEGVYVIINKTKNKCYIGSSKKVIDDIAAHLEGNGNSDIYRDYKKNNRMLIKMLRLKSSGFDKTKELKKYVSEVCLEEYELY